jgi:hypothetical protein
MKRIIFSMFVFCALVFWGMIQPGYGQQRQDGAPLNPGDLKNRYIQDLIQSVSFQAADKAFDYTYRPVMGVLVADFSNTSGEEIVLGNEMAAELRAALNRGKQFQVYGKEHPISQELKTILAHDPQWGGASQRKFQQVLLNKFKPYPVDLIITGQVSRETAAEGDKLKSVVYLSPFFKPITLVEGETGKTDIRKEQFISPNLPPQMIDQALSVIKVPVVQKGRLVIVSLLSLDTGKEPVFEMKASQDKIPTKIAARSSEKPWRLSSLKDVTCWLDDKELTALQEWQVDKKQLYYNILSGLGADTIWFDDSVPDGPHSIFFSLAQDPSKNRHKTFSKSFSIKGGQSNYLFFSLQSDSFGEPVIDVQHIVDPENLPLPF